MIGETISHYRILEKLGQGGMGVVYQAEDTSLDRQVALKFLPPDMVRDEAARKRFIREAKAASALDHPNICTIFEIDETEDGQVFIAMACYYGENLKDKIDRGPLETKEIVDIALQMARGLQKAHQAGIMHRDVKPANVMVTSEGLVKLLDFGLAKLSGQDLSRSTTTMGTAAYMSPEQAGRDEVDHRTDIWSLGVVLYEMATGRKPFSGENPVAVIRSILEDHPEPLRKDVLIDEVVSRCLEKDPEDRYPDADALIDDLESGSAGAKPAPLEKSIVVLPFEDLSPGKDSEYFSDGLTEEIIHNLAQIHDLRVISRTSTMMLKGSDKAIKDIARELKVRYVLEGSVRKAENDLRITAQLVDAQTDSHLWSEKYRGTLDDIFDIQESVSLKIVDKLRLKLTPEQEKHIARRPIPSGTAYDCYQRARHLILRFSGEDLPKAEKYLQNGLDIVGDNALLYAGMGHVIWQYVNLGLRSESELGRVEEYVSKAFELEPDLALGHMLLGMIQMIGRGNQKAAIQHLKKALAVNPDEPDVVLYLAICATLIGSTAEIIPFVRRVTEQDPLLPGGYDALGLACLFEDRFPEALDHAAKAYRMDPTFASAGLHGIALAYNQRREEAIRVLKEAYGMDVGLPVAQYFALLGWALEGDRKKIAELESSDIYSQAAQIAERDPQLAWFMAEYLALLGRNDEAIDWLEKGFAAGFINHVFLSRYDPFLKNLRGMNRFEDLMEKMKKEREDIGPLNLGPVR